MFTVGADINFDDTHGQKRIADRWDIVGVAPVPRFADTTMRSFENLL